MEEHLEIEALRRELEQANYEYYVLDNPSMSDYDFDHKLRRLEELEAAHPEWITPDSPTQRVGGKVADGFQEVTHRVPLESLQDVFSVDELEEFDQRVRDALPGDVEYDVEPKVDGRYPRRWPGGGGCDGKPPHHSVHPPASAGGAAQPHCPGRGFYAQEEL